ncbi:MAG: asparagine synthase C-terminal domain-containing protein [Alphaproteobacteria bacterium]|nr:asparagine synthase C-terminal domain-containing protein [Alphaproteobacteria bacterium]MBU1516536.1 asparagine synthase C-terminal domain-containing protein [Alphaproteobacteria bacterium]MBU2094293.1 asparagine synthase C-terminal domain-containing protein [Alphaproteobacteria bacterium]MBU2154130.1 asparagine synthase C-terminal domain-containing protein [Alphaproteobacteria bacterium]MBU2307463.1 asparagine synthase C-terminal domain-containing protein [Alphaproteobacteria bacterium]
MRYLCLAGPFLAERLATLDVGDLANGGWSLRVNDPDLKVWTEGLPPVRRLVGGGVLLGEIFARPGLSAITAPDTFAATLPRAASEAARRLVQDAWGAYLAIFSEGPEGIRVLRDPSGGVDCLTWAIDGLAVATSDLEATPAGILPRGAALDWDAIADMLDDPISAVAQVALAGIDAPLPGRLEAVGARRAAHTVWSPSEMAGRRIEDPDGEGLLALVDSCVRDLTRGHARLVGEISGGLDSAIVSGSLVQIGGADKAVSWLNFYGGRPEGDERRYAQAVADHHGLQLTTVAKTYRPLSEEDFRPLCRNARPPVSAADPFRDAETAQRLCDASATALLSGQGGDAVLFQPPTPLILADRLQLEGWRALTAGTLMDAARLSRRSTWSVLWSAAQVRRSAPPPAARLGLPPGWSRRARRYRHPWFGDGQHLPPAKRLQVQGIANAQLARADSRRRRSGTLIYPLLAQPVVEHCLAVPTFQLAKAGRERGLARHAFRDRLPACIVDRRGKGDLSAFYGHMVADSLDFLRPYLLDGVLCEAGLLDRAALDVLLSPEQLIWRGGASGILQAVIIETWVRHWQTRLPDAPSASRPRR